MEITYWIVAGLLALLYLAFGGQKTTQSKLPFCFRLATDTALRRHSRVGLAPTAAVSPDCGPPRSG